MNEFQNTDIRWKQRLDNFEKTINYLNEAVNRKTDEDIILRAGMIQFYEMSFELAWNTLKDYFKLQGFSDVKSPRSVIKKAFETGLIEDGHTWIIMLENRNITSHAYDEAASKQIENEIKNTYSALLLSLFQKSKSIAENE